MSNGDSGGEGNKETKRALAREERAADPTLMPQVIYSFPRIQAKRFRKSIIDSGLMRMFYLIMLLYSKSDSSAYC